MSVEEQTKPANIDDLLKKLLLENPELIKELSKGEPAQSKESKQRERKAPSADYYLLVRSGCELCHTITETTYNMQWDSISAIFRPSIFKSQNKSEEKETKVQLITSRNCVSCFSALSELDKSDLVKMHIKLTDPEASIIRLFELKKALARLGA